MLTDGLRRMPFAGAPGCEVALEPAALSDGSALAPLAPLLPAGVRVREAALLMARALPAGAGGVAGWGVKYHLRRHRQPLCVRGAGGGVQ